MDATGMLASSSISIQNPTTAKTAPKAKANLAKGYEIIATVISL